VSKYKIGESREQAQEGEASQGGGSVEHGDP
jgi:hypothetical protein